MRREIQQGFVFLYLVAEFSRINCHWNEELYPKDISSHKQNFAEPYKPFRKVQSGIISKLDSGVATSTSPHLHRNKRGIILAKIKKIKSGLWSLKKKLWRIKKKAIEILIGKDHATPRPHYPSTGGGWSSYRRRYRGGKSAPLLSSEHGPPYFGESSQKGRKSQHNGKYWPMSRHDTGSSTKLSHADLLAIYSLPANEK